MVALAWKKEVNRIRAINWSKPVAPIIDQFNEKALGIGAVSPVLSSAYAFLDSQHSFIYIVPLTPLPTITHVAQIPAQVP